MPENVPTPRMQKHIVVTIGTKSFSGHVSAFSLVPASTTATWQGGTPDASFSDTSPSTWTVNMNVIQDWENPGSLCNFLLANEGQKADLIYKPHHDGVFSTLSKVTLVAPQIGGAVNAYNESAVTLGSTKPVATFPAPAVVVP